MSRRYPKRVWLLRHKTDAATRSPEVISPKSAAEYSKSPDWQLVEYQRVEGQATPKRSTP